MYSVVSGVLSLQKQVDVLTLGACGCDLVRSGLSWNEVIREQDRCPPKEREMWTQTPRRSHVATDAETGLTYHISKSRKGKGFQEPQELEEARKDPAPPPPSRSLGGSMADALIWGFLPPGL